MPLSRADQQRVIQIQEAAEHLRRGGPARPALADAVAFLLTDEGRKFVGRLNWQETAQQKPNLALEMPASLRDEIKVKAAAAGANLEAEVEHGLKRFLAGDFTPAQPKRWPHGQAPAKANLNVRVDAELRRRATELGKELLSEGELDWAPGITNILTSYFMDRVEEDFVNPITKKSLEQLEQ